MHAHEIINLLVQLTTDITLLTMIIYLHRRNRLQIKIFADNQKDSETSLARNIDILKSQLAHDQIDREQEMQQQISKLQHLAKTNEIFGLHKLVEELASCAYTKLVDLIAVNDEIMSTFIIASIPDNELKAAVLSAIPAEKMNAIVKRTLLADLGQISLQDVWELTSQLSNTHVKQPLWDILVQTYPFLGTAAKSTVRSTMKSLGDLFELDAKLLDEDWNHMWQHSDDRGIQNLLRETSNNTLILGLYGASDEIKQRILSNMSARAAQLFINQLEECITVPKRVTTIARTEILRVTKKIPGMLGYEYGE